VTGFSVGVSTEGAEGSSGTIWLDELSLVGSPVSAPGDDPTPEILEARRGIEQNPNDPYAHLRLVYAYMDAGRPRLAYEALNTASDLAGEDQGFFLDTAQRFAEREAWVASAAMLMRGINIQAGQPISPELETRFHEAVYKAAGDPDFKVYLAFDKIARTDEPLSLVAQGRHALLVNSDLVPAREFLNRVKNLNPDMPEAALLEAELLLKEGRIPEARQILNDLAANVDTPAWIRVMADTYLLQNQ
jgi:predicted Zn-dependent protease